MDRATDRPAAPAPSWLPPRPIRLFVWTFLAVFVVCALARVEAWPFTGWRLFSQERHRVQVSRAALVRDAGGRERPAPFGALGSGFGWHVHVMLAFDGMATGERASVCRAWLGGLRDAGMDASAVLVVEVERDVGRRTEERSEPGRVRRVLYQCTDSGATDLRGAPAGRGTDAPD